MLKDRTMPGSNNPSFINIGPILRIFIFPALSLICYCLSAFGTNVQSAYETVFHKGTSMWKAVHSTLQFVFL